MGSSIRSEITGSIALQVALARMDGHSIDKKAARYSAMAEYAMHCGRMGEHFDADAARSAIDEAVDTCIVGSPMHVEGQPIDVAAYKWMESSHEVVV